MTTLRMLGEVMKPDAYWRGIVAAAATIEIGVIHDFSPKGLEKLIGPRYFYVKLGPLVLHHDGEWDFSKREETAQERMKYVHRTARAALKSLRGAVHPDEPICAQVWDEHMLAIADE